MTVIEAEPDAVLTAALDDPAVDPYAAILWPTAIAVAATLPAEVRPGDRVVDLGAGTGLAALTAARLGAHAVALDHSPVALGLIERAAAMQGLRVETRCFDLGCSDPVPPADLVILADLLYEPGLARAAARRTVECAARGSRVLVGDPGRFARAEFLRVLDEAGLAPTFVEVQVAVPGEARPAAVGLARLGG